MSDAPLVEVTYPRPHVAQITLNRPERMNAMSFDLVVPFRQAIDSLAGDNNTWVVVLTGTGRGFCAGADLEDSGIPPGIDGLGLSGIAVKAMEYLSDLVLALRSMPQPVIAAVNGPAIGGGMCLSLGADIRVAARSARFRAAGINNGLTANELGVSFLLPRAIGTSRAFEILLTGRDVDSAEAERIGLVSRTVADEDLLDTCYDMAEQMCGHSRVGTQLTKQVLWSALEINSLEAAINLENRSQLHVRLTTDNFAESIRARRDGRTPVFED
jgi:enoyl-CoA hydratase